MSNDRELRGASAAVTASAKSYSRTARGLYLGTSDDVTVVMEEGQEVEFAGLAAGVIHPIRFVEITAISVSDGLVLF